MIKIGTKERNGKAIDSQVDLLLSNNIIGKIIKNNKKQDYTRKLSNTGQKNSKVYKLSILLLIISIFLLLKKNKKINSK